MKNSDNVKRILVIASHPDDEVLGCGGTIAKHVRSGNQVSVLILTDGESSRQTPATEIRKKSLEKSCKALGVFNFKNLNYKDNLLDSYPILDIIRDIENFSEQMRPHIVFTHSLTDLNQDHRVAHIATMTAFRPLPDSSVSAILTYEVPSSTEYGQSLSRHTFSPNYFEVLSNEDVEKKIEALYCYSDELRDFPHPRSLKNISALLTIRGSSVGASNAEAFFLEKLISK